MCYIEVFTYPCGHRIDGQPSPCYLAPDCTEAPTELVVPTEGNCISCAVISGAFNDFISDITLGELTEANVLQPSDTIVPAFNWDDALETFTQNNSWATDATVRQYDYDGLIDPAILGTTANDNTEIRGRDRTHDTAGPVVCDRSRSPVKAAEPTTLAVRPRKRGKKTTTTPAADTTTLPLRAGPALSPINKTLSQLGRPRPTYTCNLPCCPKGGRVFHSSSNFNSHQKKYNEQHLLYCWMECCQGQGNMFSSRNAIRIHQETMRNNGYKQFGEYTARPN